MGVITFDREVICSRSAANSPVERHQSFTFRMGQFASPIRFQMQTDGALRNTDVMTDKRLREAPFHQITNKFRCVHCVIISLLISQVNFFS